MYLTLPREVLANPQKDSTTPLPPTEIATPQPSARHIETLAGWIAAAELPLILTSNLGRDLGAVGMLAELAERHAIPVAQPHASCVNLPASHPFNSGTPARSCSARPTSCSSSTARYRGTRAMPRRAPTRRSCTSA